LSFEQSEQFLSLIIDYKNFQNFGGCSQIIGGHIAIADKISWGGGRKFARIFVHLPEYNRFNWQILRYK